MTNNANQNANFLDFPPAEVPSVDEHVVRYLGIVKSLGPGDEKTAVVRTVDGCDVECSTQGCSGVLRLRERELVQICYHQSGQDEGKTFVEHAAAECTPSESAAQSAAGSLVGSLAGSRVGSCAPSRAPSRPHSPIGA